MISDIDSQRLHAYIRPTSTKLALAVSKIAVTESNSS